MRIMGLDYGDKTVGVAISDPLGFTAQNLETITRKQANKLRKTYARIEELAQQYEVERFVVGLPLLMDGEEGERARLCREFAQDLERRTAIPVEMYDERLTTASAHRVLDEAGIDKRDRKQYLDGIAATYILQGYLDSRPKTTEA